MKLQYRCDVCGEVFDGAGKCREHERDCKQSHGTGLQVSRDLNRLLKTLEGVTLGAELDGKSHRVTGATYVPEDRLVKLTTSTGVVR